MSPVPSLAMLENHFVNQIEVCTDGNVDFYSFMHLFGGALTFVTEISQWRAVRNWLWYSIGIEIVLQTIE